MSDLRKIIVDGKEVEVPLTYTLLQAVEERPLSTAPMACSRIPK